MERVILLRKAALLLAILLFVLLPAGCGSPASPADTSGFITLSSEITELEPGLSAVRYEGDSGLLFPTYTYDDEAGYVAQRVRGGYTRDDEVTVSDPKCGERYLFSDGLLRFYYKDAPGANITATPVGAFADTNGLTEAVQKAHEDNLEDVWHVEVYFIIQKNID